MGSQTASADDFDLFAPAAEAGPNLAQILLRRKALIALGVVVGAVLGALYYVKAAHVYEAAVNEQKTQRDLLRDLADRAFGGSTASLVIQALSLKKASPEELEEIRKLLDKKEGEKK